MSCPSLQNPTQLMEMIHCKIDFIVKDIDRTELID